MNDNDVRLLTEVEQRAKSNSHQIEELKIKFDKLEEKTEDIHVIATSIQLISQDMNYMKKGQEDLSNKVDNLSDKVEKQNTEIKTDVKNQIADVQKKIDIIDDEGKFNIRKYLRDNWVAIVIGLLGLIAYGNTLLK